MTVRTRDRGSMIAALVLVTGTCMSLAAQEPEEAASAVGYQPPVFSEETISLIEAVRITLAHQPNILLQSQDELLKAGLARQATGQFDTTLAGSLNYQYTQQELTQQAKEEEQKRRDDLREEAEELARLADESEQRLADFENAQFVFESGGDLTSVTFTDPVDQANWALIIETLNNAEPGSEDETREVVNQWLIEQVNAERQQAQETRAEQQNAEQILRDLGQVPQAEKTYRGDLNLELRKQYRSGPTFSPFLTLSGAGSNYVGKGQAPEKGGKGQTDTYRAVVGFRVNVPLGRGRGIDSTGAAEQAATTDYEAAVATTTHTAANGVLQTMRSYWQLVAAQRRLEVLERSLVLNQRILELSRAMVDADEMARAELARTLARETETRARVEEARRGLHQARLDFVTVVGLQVAHDSQAPLASDDFPPSPDPARLDAMDPGVLTLTAFANRKDFEAIKLLEESGQILFRGATLDIKRKTDLTAEVSYSGTNQDTNAAEGIGGAFTGSWVGPSAKVGLVIDWPIQNNVQLGRHDQQRARYNQSTISTRDLARKIQSNVVLTTETLRESARRLRQLAEAVDYYRESVAAELDKFQLGMSTLIDTLFTEQNQLSAELALVDSQQQYAELLAQLRFETATLLVEEEEGWVVGEADLVTPPVAVSQ